MGGVGSREGLGPGRPDPWLGRLALGTLERRLSGGEGPVVGAVGEEI